MANERVIQMLTERRDELAADLIEKQARRDKGQAALDLLDAVIANRQARVQELNDAIIALGGTP